MRENEILFDDKDQPLREDVSLLGRMVGAMLREQEGEDFYALVERVRKAAIARREGAPASDDLAPLLSELPAGEALRLVRGFAAYFQVVNLAERVHRIRRRRDYQRDHQEEPQRRGIHDAIRQLAIAGLRLEDVEQYLGNILYEPVFTAHPTEATRRTLLEKQQLIARHLIDRFDPSRTPQEEQALLAQITTEITSAWQTLEHPSARMTVRDERENVLFFLTDVIYRVIPPFYEAVEDALVRVYGPQAAAVRVPLMIRFASWVGGDMDGNPNVGAETIRHTLAEQRRMIIRCYEREIVTLSRRLSQSVERIGVNDDVVASVEEYDNLFPEVAAAVHLRHGDMYYRRLLRQIGARLKATKAEEETGYESAARFFEDLRMIARSLRDNKGQHAGLFVMRRLLRRVETFGFHLATLDVRQDALVHRRVIGAGLGRDDWLQLTSEQRTRLIQQHWEDAPRDLHGNDEAIDTLAVFRAIADSQAFYGNNAIGPYIISMTQGADDVLSVLLLARWAGLEGADGQINLDVAPLLETVDDLRNGPQIFAALLDDARFRAHLEQRGSRQIVMIGYSDSNKDSGIAAARAALRSGQEALVKVMRRAGIDLTFFHGRGGTISRGGGKVHRAVLAAPQGSVNGRLRVTEQGEIINAKFGLRGIALRILEQAVGATALATYLPARQPSADLPSDEIMALIARVARESYRGLVYENPDLVRYFRQATPIDVIERMQIGSRPASRRSGQGIENLRAIPWVFAWTQSRLVLTGWYGIGMGLEAAETEYGLETLQDLSREWPFFANLLDDVEMVLAKGDMEIAAHYAQLADEEVQYVYDQVSASFARTSAVVLRISGEEQLLSAQPVLQRSIRLRNPYTDPMSLVQVDLLRRWRAGGRKDEQLLDALFASVRGIAQALQNTG